MKTLTRTERKRYYEQLLLQAARRLLSALDRSAISSTCGCLDPAFWAGRTNPHPNLEMQRGLLCLGTVYSYSFPANDYYGQPALLGWITDGIRFWIEHVISENRCGEELALALHDIVQLYRILNDKLPQDLQTRWKTVLEQCCEKLQKQLAISSAEAKDACRSLNRFAAASATLQLSTLLSNPSLKRLGQTWLNDGLSRQSEEGWFYECGGADPSVQSLTLQYLSVCRQHAEDRMRIDSAVTSSLSFLQYFLHPDDSIGGEYASREGVRFFPSGCELLADEYPLAEAMVRAGVCGLADGDSGGSGSAYLRDDIVFYSSICMAYEQAISEDANEEPQAAELPRERECERVFRQAGLYLRSGQQYYIVFGASRGGILKVYDKSLGQLVFSSCGYAGLSQDNRRISSAGWTLRPDLQLKPNLPEGEARLSEKREVTVTAPWFSSREGAGRSFGAKVFARLCRMGCISKIGRLARLVHLARKDSEPLKEGNFVRVLRAIGTDLKLIDRITLTGPQMKEFREYGGLSANPFSSSQCFRRQDFVRSWKGDELSTQLGNIPIQIGRSLNELIEQNNANDCGI